MKLVHFGSQPLKMLLKNIQRHTIIIHHYNLTKLVFLIILSKIMRKLTVTCGIFSCNVKMKRLCLNDHKLFSVLSKTCISQQYGFRKNHSSSSAVLDLLSVLQQNKDKGKISCCIFLDISKAFDAVNHNILLQNLNRYGIRGEMHNLLKDYLTDRKQFTTYKNAKSDDTKIVCGIPQGSTCSIQIDKHVIPPSEVVKYLGIELNNILKWDDHAELVVKK